jgi:hypothetical protein
MTGNSVIRSALRMLGVIGEGETPSASESADVLEALNSMLDSWNTRRVNLYTIAFSDYPLVTGTQSYTIGTGGDFNQARPVKIQNASILIGDAGGTPAVDKVRLPLDLINSQQWSVIKSQTAQSTVPEAMYPDYAFPLCNLRFWPVPTFSGTAPRVEIYYWTILAAFADLTSSYTLPPGYELAIKSNLALLIAPEYDQVASQELIKTATESFDSLRALNVDNMSPGGEMVA